MATNNSNGNKYQSFPLDELQFGDLAEAEKVLQDLAKVFFADSVAIPQITNEAFQKSNTTFIPDESLNLEARYRSLVEQIPAVVFMASLDKGVGEAYVSPHIEKMLGFTQSEWLNDPVRWYRQIHPEDKGRWSVEAAQMFLVGQELKSVYRVIARDGHTVWFHCEAKMVRTEDGRPWFIHGVGFDITELKEAENALNKTHKELQESSKELSRINESLIEEAKVRRKAEREAQEYAERLTGLSRHLIKVQEMERHKISTELNQKVSAELINLKQMLDDNRSTVSSDDKLAKAQSMVDQLIIEIGKMSLNLQPSVLEKKGLLPAFLWYFEHFTAQTQIQIQFKHIGLEGKRVAAEVEATCYRVLQESLTNIALHAKVAQAMVRIWVTGDRLVLQIDDAGVGFNTEKILSKELNSGLLVLRERLMLLGGKLKVESQVGKGTRITLEWELSK